MKKIGFMLAMALFVAVGVTSCTGSSEKEDKAVADKIENKEKLTDADYSLIIDYVGEYAEKAQKYVDLTINGEDPVEANEGMEKLKEEYPDLDLYRNCLKATPLDALSPDNLEKVKKYAGYIEFTAPEGFEISTNVKAAGVEVATPDEENGVVAGAVDTVGVSKKGW